MISTGYISLIYLPLSGNAEMRTESEKFMKYEEYRNGIYMHSRRQSPLNIQGNISDNKRSHVCLYTLAVCRSEDAPSIMSGSRLSCAISVADEAQFAALEWLMAHSSQRTTLRPLAVWGKTRRRLFSPKAKIGNCGRFLLKTSVESPQTPTTRMESIIF